MSNDCLSNMKKGPGSTMKLKPRLSLVVLTFFVAIFLAACEGETKAVVAAARTYSVSGAVSGITEAVVLRNNGGDDMTITADGAFSFSKPVADRAVYNVTISTQSFGQTCTVTNGYGSIAGADVTNVAVTCVPEVAELVLSDVRTLTVGTDIEARPEIYFYNDLFFIAYLYVPKSGNKHQMRIYDAGLSTLLEEYTISSVSYDYGSPTDLRGKQVGDKVYLVSESAKEGESYLFISVHNLDRSFSTVAPTENGSVLIASAAGSSPGAEILDDPTVHVEDGSIVLLTNIVTGPTSDSIHYLRKLDAKTLAVEQEGQINLGAAVGIVGMGGVSNLFDDSGVTTGVFRHMVAPGGPWEFKLVAFTADFQPIAESLQTIANQGLNLQPTGFLNWNSRYFLAHSNNDTTAEASGEEDREIWLKLFTQDFELLQAIKLDDLGIHPTLATDGEKLYLAYSSGGALKIAIFLHTI